MYIANTSFMVDPPVHERWLELLTKYYIPFLRERGFENPVFTRVLSADAEDHFTYSLQVPVADMEQYGRLSGELFAEYVAVADPLFGERVVWFASLMKRVDY